MVPRIFRLKQMMLGAFYFSIFQFDLVNWNKKENRTMRNMKKILAAGLATVMAMTMMTGCG
ncbi:hypothetical protein, partial [Anaerostipes sp.]|uniref:hypothetical protein n=1 Tax=Anaerostipes sp. TaxID=1872530 RepID=UPI002583816C